MRVGKEDIGYLVVGGDVFERTPSYFAARPGGEFINTYHRNVFESVLRHVQFIITHPNKTTPLDG